MTIQKMKSAVSRALAAGLLLTALAGPARAAAAVEPPLSAPAFQALLQRFVDQAYLKGFRHLGDERDFDHGHFLFDDQSRLVAILYHTQELAGEQTKGSDFGYIDRGARNWIQWVKGGKIENAGAYLRAQYPSTPAWDYFRMADLPGLKAKHTVLPKMLDPKLGIDAEKTEQHVFTRIPCAPSAAMRVVLPTQEEVCLSLAAS
jgi:hypothetical protein